MAPLHNFVSRGSAVLSARGFNGGDDTLLNLMIAFLGLAFFALCLVALILVLRRVRQQRRAQEEGLPQYNESSIPSAPPGSDARRLTIQTADGRSSVIVVNGANGKPMLADPQSPPTSPTNIPEIHITFPDEHDEYGEKHDGRVVVVRCGDTTIGLEPVKEEQLPAYEKESSQGFYSIDMDQIGGLKEKDRAQFS